MPSMNFTEVPNELLSVVFTLNSTRFALTSLSPISSHQ